jgi:SpoVK/Ycf46/Vps4 family AAA+-type ATPase
MSREQFEWVAQHERRMLVIDEIDAIARSRRESGNMHGDEKANVNELLVQLDRVSLLGRLVVGTTNFVESLDDAVVRSGRFGRFVPVAPPDIDEAVDILNYYLERLIDYESTNDQPRVQVPEVEELGSILRPLFAENAAERRFFCGADLEEAVNRTYQRCLRSALGDDTWPEDYTRVNVNLTSEELTRSLRDVPRSVTEEAVEQFILDIKRYCGNAVASQFEQRLGVEG